MVILIGYKKRSGKDTVANIISNYVECQKLSFAQPLKEILADTLNISLSELEDKKNNNETINWFNGYISFRQLLQRFGNGKMKTFFGKDVWVKLTESKIKDDLVVISDFRFKEEYEYLKKFHKVITIKVERDLKNDDKDESENDLNDFKFDYVINNNGTLIETEKQVIKILSEVLNE